MWQFHELERVNLTSFLSFHSENPFSDLASFGRKLPVYSLAVGLASDSSAVPKLSGVLSS